MVEDITDAMNSDKSARGSSIDNTEGTKYKSSRVKAVFIKTFEQYCEETKKVALIPKDNKITKAVFGYAMISSPGVQYRAVHMFGLYFPNDVEIAKFCEEFDKEYAYVMQNHTLSHPEKYFTDVFMTKLVEEHINAVNFETYEDKNDKGNRREKEPFQDTKEFLMTNIMRGFGNGVVEDLTRVIGKEYEKMNIFSNDIRINALNICQDITIIGNFEKRTIGYVGDILIGEVPSTKNKEISKK